MFFRSDSPNFVRPEPDSSAKASRYKWEVHVIQSGAYTASKRQKGRLLQKYRDMIQMGAARASRYLPKAPQTGVDVTLSKISESSCLCIFRRGQDSGETHGLLGPSFPRKEVDKRQDCANFDGGRRWGSVTKRNLLDS